MCGILGLLSNSIIDKSKFLSALDLLNHRGPDKKDFFEKKNLFLGHTRLSIFDLSNMASQPMTDPDTGSTIIFNGSIYNFIELKKKYLPHTTFKSKSDTEVLLNLLVNHGYEIINELNGMWAFAFYDKINNKILLSRDRFGQKPLYYIIKKNIFCFSSEIKPIIKLYPENNQPNIQMIKYFLDRNLLNFQDNSFFKEIKIVESGTNLIIDVNNFKINKIKYWEYPRSKIIYNDIKTYNENFKNIFNDAVKLRLRGDKESAVSLSGGLDSSSILASVRANNNFRKIDTFTSASKSVEFSEHMWALVANRLANAKNTLVFVNDNKWLDNLHKSIFFLESPSYSPAIIPYWSLIEKVKMSGYKVLLEGQGADEAIGGYQKYASSLFLNKNILNNFIKLVLISKYYIKKDLFYWVLRKKFPNFFLKYSKKFMYRSLLKFNFIDDFKHSDPKEIQDQLILDHQNNILPGLLKYGDNISMAHGIETRNPYLDYRLVNLLISLPDDIRFFQNQSKYLIRNYLKNNNFEEISNRKDKVGYITPISQYIMNDKRAIIDLLEIKNVLDDLIDKKNVIKLVKNYSKNVSDTQFIFKIITTQIWLNQNF